MIFFAFDYFAASPAMLARRHFSPLSFRRDYFRLLLASSRLFLFAPFSMLFDAIISPDAAFFIFAAFRCCC